MFKKVIIVIIALIAIALAALYFYRHTIIKHYTEKLIRENLPGYIQIEKVNFDFANSKISLNNFRVLGPPGFSPKYVIEVKEISCKYGILGKWIPRGLELHSVLLNGADIRVERLRNGRVNVAEMERFIQDMSTKDSQLPPANRSQQPGQATPNSQLSLSSLIKLPTTFDIKNSRFIFIDKVPYTNPYFTTVESINGQASIGFADGYSKITNLSFAIAGNLNGNKRETIQWTASLDPTRPKLTMSNRFEVSDLDLLVFEPYYDQFSPFVFKRGRFSGTLVFDFNNANIGSTNEIHLSNLAFTVKPGMENSQMWETTVPDLLNYFTTTSGDIVFDFKLKGSMDKPEFYLGPISKRALTSMALHKVTSFALEQMSKQGGGSGSDMDKAKEAIDMFKGFLKKK
jgi:uncharacterized protein involved in outer membrane biogenesis